MRNKKTNELAIVAMFIATITVLGVLNQIFLVYWPFLIKPTILHIPVIIASIVLGPRLGGLLGLWWGINSVTIATVTAGPTSFLFTPFLPVPNSTHGDVRSLLIAIVPRILVGILPYFIYKLFSSKKPSRIGLSISGIVGSMTNTIFVLSAIYVIFGKILGWGLKTVLTSIVATNSLAEAIIAAILVAGVTPAVLKVYKK
ncbi:Uncharacterized membrane protein [Pilibacter termitis]|uniref:Uncharacterized membrane protein n=1 Tax=Pilibacter termitis TaxID=263852 RepID=A0A1T4K2U8_9ENTE|nr:ECF transporter S component [Pilibacter termitis]SJZ36597.1 Uncharacterized membrane protein [Pilibacter termitis]